MENTRKTEEILMKMQECLREIRKKWWDKFVDNGLPQGPFNPPNPLQSSWEWLYDWVFSLYTWVLGITFKGVTGSQLTTVLNGPIYTYDVVLVTEELFGKGERGWSFELLTSEPEQNVLTRLHFVFFDIYSRIQVQPFNRFSWLRAQTTGNG